MGLDVNKRIHHKNNTRLDFRQSNLTDISPKQKSIRENIQIDGWNMDLIEDYNWYLCNGYLRTTIDGKKHYLHHMVAERMGLDCSDQIDHIDGDRENNHQDNLRIATRSQNGMNRKKQSNNKSGYIGISWAEWAKKWRAEIRVRVKRIHLGYFDDPIVAAKTRDRAALKYHGEFARLNFPDLKSNYLLSFLFRS